MKFLLLAVLLIIILAGLFFLSHNNSNKVIPNKKHANKPLSQDELVKKAELLFQTKKSQGMDFSSGPCLSNDFVPDWVVDVAHEPRETIDDKPENQCSAFREGRAHHFIELDPSGNFIRAY